MESNNSNDEIQAQLFIDGLRQASRRSYDEQLSNHLCNICLEDLISMPLIATKLNDLKSDRDYLLIIKFINASGMGFIPELQQHLPPVTHGKILSPEEALHQTLRNGRESAFLSVLIKAIQQAQQPADRWVAMKSGFFGLNKLGHHRRANECSLIAHVIAAQLGDEALRQRSAFAILHSTRMVGSADIREEYRRENTSIIKGQSLYSETNQCLVPIYAAMHSMDLNQNDKSIQRFLQASDDFLLYKFARLNNKLGWARYNYMSGKTHRAKNLLHELLEEFSLSTIDAPVIKSLLLLAKDLSVDLGHLYMPTITPATQQQWRQFDLSLHQLWVGVKEKN